MDPINPVMSLGRIEQARVQWAFVAQEEESLGIGVQAADGIDAAGESEGGECPMGGCIGGELGQHTVGFVKREEHRRLGNGVVVRLIEAAGLEVGLIQAEVMAEFVQQGGANFVAVGGLVFLAELP